MIGRLIAAHAQCDAGCAAGKVERRNDRVLHGVSWRVDHRHRDAGSRHGEFTTPGDGLFAALTTLGLVFSLMTFLWLTAYALVVAKAGEVLGRPPIRRWIETVTGTLLVALGLRIAAEQS